MSNVIDAERAEREEKEARDKGFAAWLEEPLTRMCISNIPPGERPESLQLLLRAAFDKGFTAGSTATVKMVMTHMLPDRKSPRVD